MTDKEKVDKVFQHMYKRNMINRIIFNIIILVFIPLFFLDLFKMPLLIQSILFLIIPSATIIIRVSTWLRMTYIDYNHNYKNFGIIKEEVHFQTIYYYGFDLFFYTKSISITNVYYKEHLNPSTITNNILNEYDKIFTSNSKPSSIENEYYKQLK